MRLKLPVPATAVSPEDDDRTSIGSAQPPSHSLNEATLYLSAAAHLRQAMLPARISDVSRFSRRTSRAPHPVGRSYAMRVLLSAEGMVPMPAVDLDVVRRNCRAAILQTLLRDIAALGVVTTAIILQPLGTLIVVLLFLVPLMATARRKVPPGVPVGIVLAILLAVAAVNPSPRNLFFVPLIAFATLFLIATVDLLWSAHRVRGLWRQTSAVPARTPDSSVVYYNKRGFIGSGVASSAFPLTVPLDKAKDKTKPVHDVTAAKLLAYIGHHLATQGVNDDQPHGYAHDPATATSLPAEPTPADDGASPRHFTYGLPYLDVDQVVAVPVPPTRKVPLTRFSRLSLNYAEHPAVADMHRTVDKSPSDFPYRHYTRAITASWDGQLVVSVFVSAALQGHFLQVVIRPYLIAPIGADLKAADSLVGRPHVALILSCLAMSARQFLRAAERVNGIARRGVASRSESAEAESVKPDLLSIRERYAQPATDHIYHSEDAARLITLMEEKVIRATMRYLEICNVDVIESEARIMNTFVQNTINGAGNIVVDSTISQSTMTATSGQGNATTNDSGGSGKP
jgi:hypothetical protein